MSETFHQRRTGLPTPGSCYLKPFRSRFLFRRVQEIHPISYAVPAEIIVDEVPAKSRDFAPVVPGDTTTYTFGPGEQEQYLSSYRKSYFGLTWRKSGWDTLRHYEILASGCVPIFPDLDQCPAESLTRLPKHLLIEAQKLPGVDVAAKPVVVQARGKTWKELKLVNARIDHGKFDHSAYDQIAAELLEYTKKNLSTISLAKYLLQTTGRAESIKTVLFLSHHTNNVHYQRELLCHGLKRLIGADNVFDVPKIAHLYQAPAGTDREQIDAPLYGNGFSYARHLVDQDIDRTNIEQRIRDHAFDLIVVTVGPLLTDYSLPLWKLITKCYARNEICAFDGMDQIDSDFSDCVMRQIENRALYFRRESARGDMRAGHEAAADKVPLDVGRQVLAPHTLKVETT